MNPIDSSAVAGALAWGLATAVVVPYVSGWMGLPPMPGVVAALACLAGVLSIVRGPSSAAGAAVAPLFAWGAVVVGAGSWLVWQSWPRLLPPGGGSDLTHHLMLVDVLERSRHLVDGDAMGGALGEMAHYTPGLHLAIVTLGALAGVDAWRAAHPLVVTTVALKAGFVFLLAHRVLAGTRGRLPLAVASVLLVLFVPRVYSLGGFLQSGYLAQVAAEMFAVAGWWALAEWHAAPAAGRMALVGASVAATFLVWPIWIGPLMVTAVMAILRHPNASWPARRRLLALAVGPVAVVAALHLSRHAAWLRMAGTTGAVPAFVPDTAWWTLLACAVGGLAAARRLASARVVVWFPAVLALQAVALVAVARAGGAETPYMAVKMTYLAAYPLAVLAALGLGRALMTLPARIGELAAWGVSAMVCLAGARLASGFHVPAPVASPDFFAAGAWARQSLAPACVEYVVADGDTAYWLHLAVMRQPRASARTADLDAYSLNAAVGRWIDGSSLPYAVADVALLPSEVRQSTTEVRRFGRAAVIRRAPRAGDPTCVTEP